MATRPDPTLREVARIIGDAVRASGDLAARYGGEEFVLLLANVTAEQAEVVARRLCDAVAGSCLAHAHRDDGSGVVSVSIGWLSGRCPAPRRSTPKRPPRG